MATTNRFSLTSSSYIKIATLSRCTISIESGRARVIVSVTDPSDSEMGHLISGEADKLPSVLTNNDKTQNVYIKPLQGVADKLETGCVIVITKF